MRRSRFRGRARKRSVAWIPGITTYEPVAGVSNRLVALAPVDVVNLPNVWGASIALVLPADLPLHGGEDCVLTRTVGRLGFMEGRRDAGAGVAAFGYQLRVTIAQTDFTPAATITPWGFTSSVGMGNDDILWEADVVVPNMGIGAAGAGYDTAAGGMERWLEIDSTAKRKVQEDRVVVVWFQTVMAPGTVSADFRLLGGLRALLKRPV